MRRPLRLSTGFILAAALIGGSCKNPESFVTVEKHTDTIVDLFNYDMFGQAKQVFRATVLPEPDMIHPHFEGRWSFQDDEKPVDVYVIPSELYNDQKAPADQDSIFFSSVGNSETGDVRQKVMEVHPTPGEWVIVYYNALPFGPTSRARVSSQVHLTYFK